MGRKSYHPEASSSVEDVATLLQEQSLAIQSLKNQLSEQIKKESIDAYRWLEVQRALRLEIAEELLAIEVEQDISDD